MTPFAIAILLLSLTPAGAAARGSYHHVALVDASAPCGVGAGGLPDPAETRRCLAAQFKPPKPKPADSRRLDTPTNAATTPAKAQGG